MSKNHPNVYIIAGPNGAGKTTFAKEFLPSYVNCKIFVNADQIAEGLAQFAPETVAIKAGRILLKELRNLADQNADFAFETTLSGKTYIPFFKILISKGYRIHIFFLWIPNVNLALARIRERVSKGGHNIPSQDVRRRFKKSLHNFVHFYLPLTDHWNLLDNSVIPPSLIATGKGNKIRTIDINYLNLLKTKENLND